MFIDQILGAVLLLVVAGAMAFLVYASYRKVIVPKRWYVMMDKVNYDVTREVKEALKLESPYTGKHIWSGCLDFIRYWTTIDDPVVIKLANGLRPFVEGMNDYDKATFILRFVQQNTKYVLDKDRFGWEHTERWVFPVDTLKDRKGDCEDTSFLCAGLMYLLGLDVVVVSLPGHICVGVYLPEVISGMKYEYNGKLYRHVETIDNTQIGEFVKDLGEPDCIRVPEIPSAEFKSRLRP